MGRFHNFVRRIKKHLNNICLTLKENCCPPVFVFVFSFFFPFAHCCFKLGYYNITNRSTTCNQKKKKKKQSSTLWSVVYPEYFERLTFSLSFPYQ